MILIVAKMRIRAEYAAGAMHVESDHFKAAMELLPRLVAEIPEIVNVEVPDGWARMSEIQLNDSP
jgi:hypothetical protein